MILTIAKYHESLLKDSTLSLLSVVEFFTSSESKTILKLSNETFLKITRYQLDQYHASNVIKQKRMRAFDCNLLHEYRTVAEEQEREKYTTIRCIN